MNSMMYEINRATVIDVKRNEDKELVSIIIPIYNGQEYLKDTIKCCIAQNHNNIEIILIDDASTDSSLEIIKEMCQEDDRIWYLRNESNRGLIKTINYAISKSSGNYIICLGQDDLLQPDHLKIMISYMRPEVALVFCQSDVINGEGKVRKICEPIKKRKINVFELSKGNKINSCGLLMSKKHIDLVGGYTEIDSWPNYGEWDMWIKLASVGEIVYTDSIRSLYRRHNDNISRAFYNFEGRNKLWRYYCYCRKSAWRLGGFSQKESSAFVLYSIVFFLKFLYRSVMGERKAWRLNS